MKRNQRSRLESILSTAALAFAFTAICAVPVFAATQYMDDGAIQNPLGGWTLPDGGSCAPDATLKTRAECAALRVAATGTPAACATGYTLTTGSVCNDLVHTDAVSCAATPGRLWNAGTNVCAITLKGFDRNGVQCALLGGAYAAAPAPGICTGNWVMPDAETFTPPLLNRAGANPSTGDQCLRCHRRDTEWNSTRVRDVDMFLAHGHKNIVKPVIPGTPQYDPEGDVFPKDEAGNPIDFVNGKITVSPNQYDLVWLVNNWMSPLVRSFYKGPATGAGVCSDPRFTAATCVANGGTVSANSPGLSYSCARCHTTGWTSDATLQSSKLPESKFPGITWDRVSDGANKIILTGGISGDANKFASWDVWGIGCNKCHGAAVENSTARPMAAPAGMSTPHNTLTGVSGDVCSNPNFTAATCVANGGTVQTAVVPSGLPAGGACSVAGVCVNTATGVLDLSKNTAALCTGTNLSWQAASNIAACLDIEEHGKEHGIPAYAAAKFTGTQPQRGQIITAVCLNCHRADTAGVPNELNGAGKGILAGNSHGVLGFVGHAVGQEFLNSPHALYTGTMAGVATGKFNFAGTGEYKSHFLNDGEAANTGNGCTGCHAIHESRENNGEKWVKEECTECHTKTQAGTLHPAGVGTPFENDKPLAEACAMCHMPGGFHLFRINTDVAYSTFPAGAAVANTNANVAADGTYANAVWVDVDLACGQCHGGGSKQSKSGDDTITAISSANITVSNAVDFYQAAKVRIVGAGALQADGLTRADFVGTVKSVAGSVVTLMGAPTTTVGVVGKRLEQNFTINGAGYKDKTTLAEQAENIHQGDAPEATFTVKTTALKVDLDASDSTCQGSNANCNAFAWAFFTTPTPPASPVQVGSASGKTASFTFSQPGTYRIDLTVTQYSAGTATVSRTITVNGPAPTANGTCAFDANSWTANVTDTSVAGGAPIRSVAIFWGDGSTIAMDTGAPFGPFSHQYMNPKASPGYAINLKATDQRGRQTTRTLTCTPEAAPAYFAINGFVLTSADAPIALARVQLFQGTKLIRAVYSDATGAFVLGNLKPGSYTVVTTKVGFTFTGPIAVGVGPSGPVGPIRGTPAP